jgi:hypothetical protein
MNMKTSIRLFLFLTGIALLPGCPDPPLQGLDFALLRDMAQKDLAVTVPDMVSSDLAGTDMPSIDLGGSDL